ncbi:MAG: hydrogenase formation protein HypD, partial [Candidatus Zixiibacteriota bacterium]
IMNEVFTAVNRKWRGFGEIPASGLGLREAYSEFDAEEQFGLVGHEVEESTECISGQILQGRKRPSDCPAFGTRCTPERPLGATMVSSEGTCAAYFRYRRKEA